MFVDNTLNKNYIKTPTVCMHNYVDIVVMYSQSWFCFHTKRLTRSKTRKGIRSKYRIGVQKLNFSCDHY